MTISGIYQIRNLINSKVYIGSTKDIKYRWSEHRSNMRRNKHNNPHLQSAFNKYGEENFVFEILLICEPFELDRYEDEVEKYNRPNCYNIREITKSNLGFHQSEDTKKKIGNSVRGRVHSKDSIERMREVHRGKQYSKESKKKMSETHKRILTLEEKKRLNKFNIEKVVSDETRKKMSIAQSRRRLREERKFKSVENI